MSGLSDRERWDRLRLARTDQVGAVTFHALLARFKTAGEALAALPELSRRGGRTKALQAVSLAEIDQERQKGTAFGAELVVFGDPHYPKLLKAIDAPPPVLWVKGHKTLLEKERVLAIVGARNASAAGMRIARDLALGLGHAGYPIVSGLARGIDRAAHEGALETGTLGVLAGGIDDIYPPQNTDLYHRLSDIGLILSENAMGTKAQARDFPRRNRVISGLSLGVVVVEAELRSGSLITARFATEQGREVFAVPGSPLDPRSKGVNNLIRQGAVLCESIEDILKELSQFSPMREPDYEKFEVFVAQDATLLDVTDELRERIIGLLSPTPVPRDDLVKLLQCPAALVLAALIELSLAGRVDLSPGGLVCLKD